MRCPYCDNEINLKELRLRTTPQNRYYYGVVVTLLSDHTGYSKNEIHEMLKNKFLTEVIAIKTPKKLLLERTTRSSTELTTAEFEEYLSQITQWAAEELSVVIPEPNDK